MPPVNADTDELDDEDRARLHEALRESVGQMKAGQTVDAAEALAEIRAHVADAALDTSASR